MKWDRVRIGDVCQIIGGTTPDSGNPDYWGGDVVWVTPTDLGKLDSWVIVDSARKLSDAAVAEVGLPLVPAGSVVMSSRAPIGHLAIAGRDLRTNQGCKSFACSERIDPEFLFLTLRHRMNEIRALGSGATFVEVSKSVLEGFDIHIPDVEAQRLIAARLKNQLAAVHSARKSARAQLEEIERLPARLLARAFEFHGDSDD